MTASHLLSERLARTLFEEVVAPSLFTGRTAPARPAAILVGGQPGAGKTTVQNRVLRRLGQEHAVTIDMDDLRAFHPDYVRLAREDDLGAADATQADVRRWLGMALAYALDHRLDVVVSTTLRDPDDAARRVRLWCDAGYQVDVVYVAVDLARSGLGVLRRYVADRRNPALGYGRYVPRAVQVAAYTALPATAQRIDVDVVAGRVHVFRSGGERIYLNRSDGTGRWESPPGARRAIECERRRHWSVAECAAFDDEVSRLRQLLPRPLEADLNAILADALPRRTPAIPAVWSRRAPRRSVTGSPG